MQQARDSEDRQLIVESTKDQLPAQNSKKEATKSKKLKELIEVFGLLFVGLISVSLFAKFAVVKLSSLLTEYGLGEDEQF